MLVVVHRLLYLYRALLALLVILCPFGGLVGGCGAQAVSLKTPIYFIIYKRGQLKNTLYMTERIFLFFKTIPKTLLQSLGG